MGDDSPIMWKRKCGKLELDHSMYVVKCVGYDPE